MIYLKNTTDQVKQLHLLEFQPDETLEVDMTWYNVESVIEEIVSGNFEVHGINGLVGNVPQQLSYLSGDIKDVRLAENTKHLVTNRPFAHTNGFRFRGQSFLGEVNHNETKDIDFKIEEERWINGGRLVVDNRGEGDKCTFEVVDKDYLYAGTLYPADFNGVAWETAAPNGVVLDTFIDSFFIPTTGDLQVNLAYPARLVAGLYVRLKYTSTHAGGAKVKCNLYLHMKSV